MPVLLYQVLLKTPLAIGQQLGLEMLKGIYGRYPGALNENCHFLNFHSCLQQEPI